MFDTHCHLQFGAFKGREEEVYQRAQDTGVTHLMMPSTDVVTSQKALQLAKRFENTYVGVGIHPHHIYQYQVQNSKFKDPHFAKASRGKQNYKSKIKNDLEEIEKLLAHKEIIAVGEIGVDRYYYKDTKYSDYRITEEFVALQREVLLTQLKFVFRYDKSLILHNREAKRDLLEVLNGLSGLSELAGRTVLHCCEPDMELLEYAKKHGFYLGVDGDVTFWDKKQEFIRKVPLEMLVLETDSPFLTPEPVRSQLDKKKRRPLNEPKNLKLIAEKVAELQDIPVERVIEQTTKNAKKLFRLT